MNPLFFICCFIIFISIRTAYPQYPVKQEYSNKNDHIETELEVKSVYDTIRRYFKFSPSNLTLRDTVRPEMFSLRFHVNDQGLLDTIIPSIGCDSVVFFATIARMNKEIDRGILKKLRLRSTSVVIPFIYFYGADFNRNVNYDEFAEKAFILWNNGKSHLIQDNEIVFPPIITVLGRFIAHPSFDPIPPQFDIKKLPVRK